MSQPPRAQAHPGSGAAADAAPGTEGGARLATVGDLLDAPNLAHFATVMPDGRPTSVPLWVGLEGDRLAVLTIPDSIKDRNIRRDRARGGMFSFILPVLTNFVHRPMRQEFAAGPAFRRWPRPIGNATIQATPRRSRTLLLGSPAPEPHRTNARLVVFGAIP